MKSFYFITGIIFIVLSCVTLGLIRYAEATVAENPERIFSYQHLSNVSVYDSPREIRAGQEIEKLEKFLQADGYAECASAADIRLDNLPVRTFCRKGGSFLVKSAPPFASYIFRLDKKRKIIQKILNVAEQEIESAEIATRPFALAAVNENGEIMERIRFEAFRGKALTENVKSDFLQICLNEEDRDFFQHRGTNWRGLARAVWRNLKIVVLRKKDERMQGGSSVTEQAAKLLYTSDDRGILRRVWSAFLADAMEQRFTKIQILEFWVNSTVLGIENPNRSAKENERAMMRERLFGFQTAAQSLFGKNWQDLAPQEQAFLAVLPRNPRIAPALRRDGKLNLKNQNHKELEEKRKTALKNYAEKLEEQGEKRKAKLFREAINQPVVFKFKEDDLLAEETLTIFLEKDLRRIRREFSPLITGKPLTIITTIDREFQKNLSVLTSNEMLKNKRLIEKALSARADVNLQVDIAVVSATGEMKAFSSLKTLGNRVLPNRSNVNSPSQLASPAKPLHLAAALSAGKITLETPIRPDGCRAPDGFQFESDRLSDAMTLPVWQHLIYSNNNAFICVGNALGLRGAEAKWREIFDLPTPSKEEYLKMGGHPYQIFRGLNRTEAELAPTGVLKAYTALANRGQKSSLRAVKAIYSGREEIELPQKETRQVFTAEAAEAVSRVLQANARASLKSLQEQSTVAIKTGSSPYSYWLVMYSPKTVVVGRFLVAGSVKSKFLSEIYAGDTIQPFMDRSVLKLLQETRPGWLSGSFGAAETAGIF